jgi:hypothetical protein
MSDNNDSEPIDLFDPTGMFKGVRDASMGAWAKMMVELVNSEAYAQASAQMLDSWLCGSAPFRSVMESVMTQSLANLNLPSRDEITRLAQRLTHIELKLDDLDAAITELRKRPNDQPNPKPKSKSK